VEHIILDYLNKNYRFTLSTYNSYFVRDRVNESNIRLADAIISLKDIFSVDDDMLMSLIDKWCDQQIILLNNRIVHIREELYKKGVDIEISVDQMNSMLLETDEKIDYNRFMY
jgi:hypothetical protein